MLGNSLTCVSWLLQCKLSVEQKLPKSPEILLAATGFRCCCSSCCCSSCCCSSCCSLAALGYIFSKSLSQGVNCDSASGCWLGKTNTRGTGSACDAHAFRQMLKGMAVIAAAVCLCYHPVRLSCSDWDTGRQPDPLFCHFIAFCFIRVATAACIACSFIPCNIKCTILHDSPLGF